MFVPRSREELKRDFRETFLRLVRAGAAFDKGHGYEGPGIAATVYSFVHDYGKKNPSLLTLLGRKDSLLFVDTAPAIDPKNLFTAMPLVMVKIDMATGKSIYAGKLDQMSSGNIPSIRFTPWWDKYVLRDSKRRLFSRKNLICYFRNYRGGGHGGRQHEPQDQVPAQAFADMAASDPAAWHVSFRGQVSEFEYGADYASVRQIGWELEKTIRINCADLIT